MMTPHKREIIKELSFIVDRSFAIIDEAENNISAFAKAVSVCADDASVAALGDYVAEVEEVRRLLRRARALITECDETFSKEYENYLKDKQTDPRD